MIWSKIQQVKNLNSGFFILLSIIILMLVNWGIESFKWKYLIKKNEKISLLKSFTAVLSGITVSTFTPNRIGEFFGRVFVLKKTNPWKGAFITIIGSFSQLIVTLWIGLPCIIFVLYNYRKELLKTIFFDLFSQKILFYNLLFLAIIINIGLLLFYFNLINIKKIRFVFKNKTLKKLFDHLSVFGEYSFKELIIVLTLSTLRYFVFTLQFILTLHFFKVEIPLILSFCMIASLYYTMAAIPTVALTELGVRGSLALLLLPLFYEQNSIVTDEIKMNVFSSSIFLWIINLVIPALIGSIFVLRLKFFNKNIS